MGTSWSVHIVITTTGDAGQQLPARMDVVVRLQVSGSQSTNCTDLNLPVKAQSATYVQGCSMELCTQHFGKKTSAANILKSFAAEVGLGTDLCKLFSQESQLSDRHVQEVNFAFDIPADVDFQEGCGRMQLVQMALAYLKCGRRYQRAQRWSCLLFWGRH